MEKDIINIEQVILDRLQQEMEYLKWKYLRAEAILNNAIKLEEAARREFQVAYNRWKKMSWEIK